MSASAQLEMKTVEISQNSIQIPLEDEDEQAELMEQAERNKRVTCISLCLPISFIVIAVFLVMEIFFFLMLAAMASHGSLRPFPIEFIACALFCPFLLQFHLHVNSVLPLVPILWFFYVGFSGLIICCYASKKASRVARAVNFALWIVVTLINGGLLACYIYAITQDITNNGVTATIEFSGFWTLLGGPAIVMVVVTVMSAVATYQNRAPLVVCCKRRANY